MHWHREHLERQHPLLPETGHGLVRKVKPLWRVSEMETAAYCFLKGIDYVTEECPMSHDATSLIYKEALSLIEEKMPGTRSKFYQGFLTERGTFLIFLTNGGSDDASFSPGDPSGKCTACGAPTYAETCGFCRLKEKVQKGAAR
jgi:uncharacterized protein (TIGR00269 family)